MTSFLQNTSRQLLCSTEKYSTNKIVKSPLQKRKARKLLVKKTAVLSSLFLEAVDQKKWKKSVLKNFTKFTRSCGWVSFLIKLQHALKKRLCRRCFAVIFEKVFRNNAIHCGFIHYRKDYFFISFTIDYFLPSVIWLWFQ